MSLAKTLRKRWSDDPWGIFLGVFPLVALLCLIWRAWGGVIIGLAAFIGQLLVRRRMGLWPFANPS